MVGPMPAPGAPRMLGDVTATVTVAVPEAVMFPRFFSGTVIVAVFASLKEAGTAANRLSMSTNGGAMVTAEEVAPTSSAALLSAIEPLALALASRKKLPLALAGQVKRG